MANYYEAYDDGRDDGVKKGFKSGAAEGYTKGHAEGAQSGYAKGYEEGYEAGGGGASSEWKYQTKAVIGYGGSSVGLFSDNANVLYAPNAEGDLGYGQFALMEFHTIQELVLDFPKAGPVISEKCFSGMTTAGDPATVSSGNFPEVTDIQGEAFAGNRMVMADFPKCRDVGLRAFWMQDEDSGQPSVSGNLSFAAMTPLWACFPAMSGTYGDDGHDFPYHVGPIKVPIIPVQLNHYASTCGLPEGAARNVRTGGWQWGSPGSGAGELSTEITWSGASAGHGFVLDETDSSASVGFASQDGAFGSVGYVRAGYNDWSNTVHESKFNISLPNIPVGAVANTKAFQDTYVYAVLLTTDGSSASMATEMGVLGLAGGSTITCSDGVYTV